MILLPTYILWVSNLRRKYMPDLTQARCPCCSKVATNSELVEKLFGLRKMGNGVIRVQSYCRECRILHCEAGNPKCN